jgi:alkanesulfonate monooxygenase SsuD/methylene tetrahydromethanopterin reductase-like flavin-dependent oxidoreductase (luciferase family)
MAIRFGLQTGQQQCTFNELCQVWRFAEDSGFDMIFTSDHFYGIPPKDGSDVTYETVATLTALALQTQRVRIGCMVFCPAYRSPGLIAKAAATVDNWSNGRFELGLGAGAVRKEYQAYGYEFSPPKVRMDMLEEAAQIIPAMLQRQDYTFEGNYFRVLHAQCTPPRIQDRVRLWIGGKGIQRLIPIAAKYADVWNGNNITPEEYRERIAALDWWCEKLSRDPSSIARSVNVDFHLGVKPSDVVYYNELVESRGRRKNEVVIGTPSEIIDQIGQYVKFGAQQININVYGHRPPFDWEALQCFAEEVMPVFRE